LPAADKLEEKACKLQALNNILFFATLDLFNEDIILENLTD
jgi:hypothetical protein